MVHCPGRAGASGWPGLVATRRIAGELIEESVEQRECYVDFSQAGSDPMPKSLAALIFLVIEILLLPITVVGLIVFAINFYWKLKGRSLSKTAYHSVFSRWFMHELGIRENLAAKQLWFALPGVSRPGTGLAFGPTVWAMRITGLAFYLYDFSRSSSFVDAFGQRTRFFDEAMLRYLDQIEQVVILGAGWDTRAYELARREGVRVYEVDEAETQTQKRESLEKANIDTTQVIFVAGDLNTEPLLDALHRTDLNADEPAFILMEGVTYYLEAEAVIGILQTVATGLARGSAIAFDYAGQHIVEGDASRFYRFVVPMSEVIHEQWRFGISTEAPAEERLKAFLAQNGLTLTEYEPIGQGDEKQRPDGGLALAVNH
jgi:methyltransferase (TIGR00027 family)